MKTKIIATGIVVSFCAALFDVMAGIYIAVLTNTYCNYVVISRQKKVTTKVKKSRPMTVDEFREREMEEHPYRPYHNPHSEVYK
jgi:hypothetical protein